jgi:hypothetical protein
MAEVRELRDEGPAGVEVKKCRSGGRTNCRPPERRIHI